MPTDTIYPTDVAYIRSQGAVGYGYETIRIGFNIQVLDTGPSGSFVANQLSFGSGIYYIYQGAARFDTSFLGPTATISAASMVLTLGDWQGGAARPVLDLALAPYGAWTAGPSLAGLTHLATYDYTGGIGPGDVTMADVALAANVNKSGYTDALLFDAAQQADVAPGDSTSFNITIKPRLVLTWTRPVTVTGLMPKIRVAAQQGTGGGVETGLEVTVWDGATPTTQLALLQNAKDVKYQHVLDDIGSGSFTLAVADPKATYQPFPVFQSNVFQHGVFQGTVPAANLREGNLVKIRLRGIDRFAFFIEAPTLKVSEAGDSVWTIAGRGVLSCLSWALVYPTGVTPTRNWYGVTAGAVLAGLLADAQARGTIPNVTAGFTSTTDSSGAAWPGTVSLTLKAGITLLDAAQVLVSLGYTVEMTPALQLNLYAPGVQGRDQSSAVILRQGRHIAGPVERVTNRASLANALLVQGSGGVYAEAPAGSGSFSATMLATAPAYWYRMNVASGGVPDSSGNGRSTTTFYATPTYHQPGLTADGDYSIYIGASNYFQISTASVYNPGDTFSFSMGFKRAASGANCGLWDFGTNDHGGYVTADGRIHLEKVTVGDYWVSNNAVILDSNWHYIIVTKTGASVVVYLDGSPIPGTYTPQTIGTLVGNKLVGYGVGDTSYLVGNIDEISGWGRVLSPAEALSLSQAAAGVFTVAITPDPYTGRREGFYPFSSSADVPTLTAAGNAQVALLAAAGTAVSVPLTHATGPGLFQPYLDYAPGDWVALDIPGQYSKARMQVQSLTFAQTTSGDFTVTAALGAIALDYVARLNQQIAVLAGTSSLIG